MIDNFSSTTPAAPAGYQLGKWQADAVLLDPSAVRNASLGVPNTGGVLSKTATYAGAASDCGLLITFNSSSAVTYTLPATPPFAQWTVRIVNLGSGVLTVTPSGSTTLDGGSSVTLGQWEGLSLATDGSNYFSARGLLANVGTAGTYTKVTTDAKGRVISGTTLSASDIPNIAESQVTNLVADLALLAPKASPALTGTPTAPTPSTSDNSTKIATTAYVQAQGYSALPSGVRARSITVKFTATGTSDPIVLNYASTIVGWSIIGDVSGSASVDIWFVAGSAPPTAPVVPTSSNKISASAPIALSSARTAAGGSAAISTWTTALTQWGTLIFSLASLSTSASVVIELFLQI